MTDIGGNQHQGRKLLHDPAATARYSHQRRASKDTTSANKHHTEGQSTTEDGTNGEDEDDSSNSQELDDETDEAEEPAPFLGSGKGKGRGKRPAIRVEPVDDDSQDEDDETTSQGTGLIPSKHPVNQLLMNNKKRTFSNLSSTSVLFGDDSTDQESFPRRKMARKLSNIATKPLLTYKESDNEMHENAIESDDEDYSGVNLIPDDEDDVDILEEQEESYILQEEQQATSLLNDFRDARRLSLESCLSDNIFDVTAPLGEAYISGLPDLGFAQFFEPEAVPASPDPIAKRKYSDSSTKRVRFDDEVQVSDSSSSESSELDSSVFPDLFLEQDKLPPILHQLLAIDGDDDDGDIASPQSDISFWDYAQEEPCATEAKDSDDTDDDSSIGSSGYDCTNAPYFHFFSFFTNNCSQLTWVILLTKKILNWILPHRHLCNKSLSSASLRLPQVPEPLLLGLLSAVTDQWAAKRPRFEVSSFTTIAPRPLPSQTGTPKLLPFIVHALP